MTVPAVEGVLGADDLVLTARWIAGLQLPNGMIPWFEGGHCDPWNHVETAMALDVCGFHREARRAYEWLAAVQRPDGSWWNYYRSDGSVEEAKLDSNVCAYIATGVWHHWLCTADGAFAERMWPTVDRALEWVLGMRRPDGLILWARTADATPWDYALLTGSASIVRSLRCGAALGESVGESRPDWLAAAEVIADAVAERPHEFEPKARWAMDWYYPVLTGIVGGAAGRRRLDAGRATFALDGLGIRCVSDEPWVTAAETAECAIAYAATGAIDVAAELLATTRLHRSHDGSYLTGLVHPQRIAFPFEERSAYTGAAVILAADAIAAASPAHAVLHANPAADALPR